MALASIPIPPDPKRDTRARELVPQVKTWHTGTLKQPWGAFEIGTAYFITPNGHNHPDPKEPYGGRHVLVDAF